MTTRCHSVFSLRSPVVLSRQLSEVATLRLAIGRPSWVRRISGSLPRLPTRITLFTLPAIAALHAPIAVKSLACRGRHHHCLRAAPSADLYANGGACPKVQPRASRLSTYSTACANVPVLFRLFWNLP